MKRVVLTALVLLMPFLMYASTGNYVLLEWDGPEGASHYRWSIPGGEWNEAGPDGVAVPYENGSTSSYRVQASSDGISWSDDHTVIISPDSSKTIAWTWEEDGESLYRYRIDGGEWERAEKGSVLSAMRSGERRVFEIESSLDGSAWSEPAKSIVTLERIRRHRPVVLSSFLIGSIEKLSLLGDSDSYGMGGRVSLSFGIADHIAISASVAAQGIDYASRRYIEMPISARLRMMTSEDAPCVLYAEAGFGENIVIRGARSAAYPMLSIGAGMDFRISGGLSLSLSAEYWASFQRDSHISHFVGGIGLSYAFEEGLR